MTGAASHVRCTFFGTTSIHITDGVTNIFTDAFFTRPSILKVAIGRVTSNEKLIAKTLSDFEITKLDALFVAHSHYDHLLDSPSVIKSIGGTLYGSESTLNVGRASGLAERSLHLISAGDEHTIGAFKIQIFESPHSPGNRYPGTIEDRLSLPTKASGYCDGGCFAFLITHPEAKIMVLPSANYFPDNFSDIKDVDVFYLGIGVLGLQSTDFQEAYWKHTVEAVKPKTIIPIHWDDFFKPLADRLRPLPFYVDKFSKALEFIDRKAKEGGYKLRWQDRFETIDVSIAVEAGGDPR